MKNKTKRATKEEMVNWDFEGYPKLGVRIILQAFIDYYDGIMEKKSHYVKEVITWVVDMTGTFKLCAALVNRKPEDLRDFMIKALIKINKGLDPRLLIKELKIMINNA